MPVWHERTEHLQAAGKLQMVGVIQEQHPDRARLFMQWKKMGWPILVDSYNLLQVSYVPITLFLDEHGVIREIQPILEAPQALEKGFLSKTFDEPDSVGDEPASVPDLSELETAAKNGSPGAWRALGDAVGVFGRPDRIEDVIRAYREALRRDPRDESTHFRLGVALRMRYDSAQRRAGDFQAAVDHWKAALDIDPNQYIVRRRIQQYGPRLDKPYPFYVWLVTARSEIEARGETPAPLAVEPAGAEFAEPIQSFLASEGPLAEPDPRGRVIRDAGQFIGIETIAVPSSLAPGATTRLHVIFRPLEQNRAHWNNEAKGLALWIDTPRGWKTEQHYLTLPLPPHAVSQEIRSLEVEMKAPDGAPSGPATIPAYALYYVCEGVNGVCMYRRQDLELKLEIRQSH